MAIQDDPLLFVTKRDFSGGINSRQHSSLLQDNQVAVLENFDIGVAGQTVKRPGSVSIADNLAGVASMALCNYERQGYDDVLVNYNEQNLWEWDGSSTAWSSISASAFTVSATTVGILACKEAGLTPDDVIIVQNRTESKRFHKDSSDTWAVDVLTDDNNSIPKTDVMAWYGNRVWCLKNDLLYFSDAYPSAYSSAFDRTTDSYRIPVGSEMGIAATRDAGLVVMGENEIWSLAPSVTPAATDKPEPLVTDRGVVSRKGWKMVGDDLYFFSQDGLRSLKRTVQDKLQLGVTFPISYYLKAEFDEISWANISKLSMEYFDNKLFIAVPTSSTDYDTWVYYPASNSFSIITGWHPRCWAKYRVSGEQRLYYASENVTEPYTTFLANFEGASGATTYTADTGQTVTFAGNAQLDTAQKKIGSSSLYLDGTGDYCTIPHSSDWVLQPNDAAYWTIESYIMLDDNVSAGRSHTIMGHWDQSGNQCSWSWGIYDATSTSTRNIYFTCSDDGTVIAGHTWTDKSTNLTILKDTWYHVAIVGRYSGGYVQWIYYLNGTAVDSGIVFISAFFDSTSVLSIGAVNTASTASNIFKGWIDSARISNTRRWTQTFTPTTTAYVYSTSVTYRAWNGYTDEGTSTTNGNVITAKLEGKEEDMGQPLVYKWGGELEITADAAGSDETLDIEIAVDGASFETLGSVTLTSTTAPTLPVDLPFSLADSYIIREKFHLDSYGRWRTLQVKVSNSDNNTSDIKFYSYNITSYKEEYETE